MPSLQVDAILFDVDGTLIDESQSYREAIRRTAEYLLRSPVSLEDVDEIKRVPGFNNDWDATWALVGRRLHRHIVAPDDVDRASGAYRRMRAIFQTYYLGDRMWAEISREDPPFDWGEPMMQRETPLIELRTLERLRAFKLGIATSRPRVEALMALRQHGLDRFFSPEWVVAAEDAPREKPDPAPLHELVRRLGCGRPVYVGDSINDALAAMAAGIPFVAVGGRGLGRDVVYRLADVNGIADLCAVENVP
jgi:HAD superfamily hydrolase (TIGR01548 family)